MKIFMYEIIYYIYNWNSIREITNSRLKSGIIFLLI